MLGAADQKTVATINLRLAAVRRVADAVNDRLEIEPAT
jgi:hypothetical protein